MTIDNLIDNAVDDVLGNSTDAPEVKDDPIDNAVTSFIEERTVRENASVYNSFDTEPEVAAKQYRLSQDHSLPVDVVQRNQKDIEKYADREAFDIESLRSNSPKLAKHFDNPAKAAALRDDVEVMSWFERVGKDFSQRKETGKFNAALADIGLKNMLRMELSPEERNTMNLSHSREAIDYDVGFFPGIPAAMAEMAPLMVQNMKRAGGVGLTAAAVGAGTAFIGGQLGPQAATPEEAVTVPGMALAYGTTAFTAALPVTFAMSETGLAFEEFKNFTDENGQQIEHEVAAGGAVMVGIVNGALESYGFGFVAKQFPGADKVLTNISREGMKNMMRSQGVRAALYNIGKAMISSGTVEGATEAMQEAANIIFGEMTKMASRGEFEVFGGDDPAAQEQFMSDMFSRIGESFEAGAQGGAGYGGAGATLSTASNSFSRKLQYNQEQSQLNEMVEKAKESKTLIRDSKLFEEVTEEQLEDTKVFINAEDVQTFFQDGNIEAFEEAIPEVKEQYQDALAHGGNMVLPAHKIIVFLANNEDMRSLQESMSLSPGAITDQQFNDEYMNRILPEMEALDTEGQSDIDLFETRIQDGLMHAGQTPDAARHNASLARANYETLIKEYGSDNEAVREIIERNVGGVDITNPFNTSPKAPYKADALDPVIENARKFANKRTAQGKRELPVLGMIRKMGGVKTGSQLDQELRAMGITPKTQPGLFRREGVGDVDNIPLTEFTERFGLEGIVTEDGNGYVDRQFILNAIQDEWSDNPITGKEPSADEKFLEELNRAGIDINDTNENIKAALGETYNQPANPDVDPSRKVKVVDLPSLEGEFIGKRGLKNKLIALAKETPEIKTADQKRIMRILPKNVSHVVWSGAEQSKWQLKIQKKGILNINELIKNAVLIESVPNNKTDKKPDIVSYHRFYVPVRSGSKLYAVRLVAEQSKKGLKLDPNKFDLYDIIPERKSPLAHSAQSKTAELKTQGGNTLSIGQMLAGVKDTKGQTYFQGSESVAAGLKSSLLDTARKLKQEKGTGDQILAMLRKTQGIKGEEVIWTGLDEFLSGKKSVTKDEVVDYLEENQVQIEEVTLKQSTRKLSSQDLGEKQNELLDEAYRQGYSTVDAMNIPIHLRTGEKIVEDLPTELQSSATAYMDAWLNHQEIEQEQLSGTKFGEYTLPGGENYREVLLTLPRKSAVYLTDEERHRWNVLDDKFDREQLEEKELKEWEALTDKRTKERQDELDKRDYHSSHFNQPNILAHVRLNDRTTADGKRVLFVEEIQSDWHQAGRKKGYKNPEAEKRAKSLGSRQIQISDRLNAIYNYLSPEGEQLNDESKKKLQKERDELQVKAKQVQDELYKLNTEGGADGVPDAPFKKNWHEMAFRRVAQMAAQGGYDAVAWTPGEVQNERYDLSKQVDAINYHTTAGTKDRVTINVMRDGALVLNRGNLTLEQVEELVGKDIAQKIKDGVGEKNKNGLRVISGLDLKIGGEGMKGFYDKILKKYAEKFGKKYGASVGVEKIITGNAPQNVVDQYADQPDHPFTKAQRTDVWTLPITDKMRETANGGFELFQDEQAPRGSITFTDQGTQIKLFESADLSTFSHEWAHLMSKTMQEIAALPDAPERALKDVTLLREWVGAKEGDTLTVDQEEQIARGFEAYLMEGKAPSVELQGVFRRLKAWLVRVYKSIQSLDVKITDDIRGVFDRMLATDEQIEAMSYNPLFRPDPQVMEVLNKAEREDYQKRLQKTEESAKEKLFHKALREAERVNKKWWKEERSKLRDEIETEINKHAIYRATHWLQKGKLPDGSNIDVEHAKMSRKDVEELIGEEGRKRLPRGTTAQAKGIDPAIVAEIFGFTSADQMLQNMQNLEDRKAYIERLTDEEMLSRHGDMMNDGSIEREALGVMQNAERAELIAYELEALARKTGTLYPSNKDFKEAAKNHISSKSVDEAIKPEKYYYAEVRAAREVSKHLNKKDYAKAAEAKRKQLLNHHLFRQARDTRKEVDRALKKFKKLNKAPAKGKLVIDPDYHEKIWGILDKYNLGPRLSDEKRTRLEMAALNDWIHRKETDESAQILLPQEIINADNKEHYRDLTVEEFRAMRDLVLNIETQGRKKNEFIIDGQKKVLNETAEEVAGTIYKNIAVKDRPTNPRRKGERRKRTFRNFLGVITKMQTYVEKMDGYKKGGTVYKMIREPIREAEVKRHDRMEEAGRNLGDLFFKHYGKKKINAKGKPVYVTSENLSSKKKAKYIDAIGESLTHEERLVVALNWGNEQNRERLLNDPVRGWKEGQIEAILKTLDKRDWDFVQDVWNLIDGYWPEVEALEKRRNGFPPPKVEASPVDTEYGEYKGGYYPLKYEGQLSGKVNENDINQTFKEMTTGRFSRAQTRRGHTESRVDGVELPVRLDFGVISEHLNEAITDLTMGEAIENTHKMLNHHKVKQAIEETLGVDAFNEMDIWLKDTAVGSIQSHGGLAPVWKNLRHTVTTGTMGYKLSTTLIQFTGASQAAVEIGYKWMARGIYKTYLSGNPVNAVKEVHEMSPFMKSRMTTYHRDVMDFLNAAENKGLIGNIEKSFFYPIVKAQMLVDIPTWIGGYERALSEGKDHKEAVRLADLYVESSQASGFMSSLSPIERGTWDNNTRLSEAVKLWTTFYSYFNAKINIAMRKTGQTNFRKPAEVAHLAADYLMLFWVETLIGEMILLRGPDFEDEEDPVVAGMLWNFGQAFNTFAAGVPILREGASIWQGFGSAPGPARGIEDVARGVKSIGKAAAAPFTEEEVDWYRTIKATVDAGNVISPVKYPAGAINQILEAERKKSEGDDVGFSEYFIYRK